MKRSLSVDQVVRCVFCKGDYPRARVKRLFAGRKRITVDDIATMHIPTVDKLWVLGFMFNRDEIGKLFKHFVENHIEGCHNHWELWFCAAFDGRCERKPTTPTTILRAVIKLAHKLQKGGNR